MMYLDAEGKALRTAYRRGQRAYEVGKLRTTNPYRDTRNRPGKITWPRVFRMAWFKGFDATRTNRARGYNDR